MAQGMSQQMTQELAQAMAEMVAARKTNRQRLFRRSANLNVSRWFMVFSTSRAGLLHPGYLSSVSGL